MPQITRGDTLTTLNDSPPQSTFTSISVPLSSRVSAKLKAKIFADEYVDFGALLSSSPKNKGKYSLLLLFLFEQVGYIIISHGNAKRLSFSKKSSPKTVLSN